ncbi:ADP-ribosylglycohydrolase family protein [Seonamhaeicola marinus]|nr:ADP-ribosylglycohydrolase family protein [Seonamhaeicola marinus]
MTVKERFEGCILCGAIGDAWGSAFEGLNEEVTENVFYPFGKPEEKERLWSITDDTQLTLVTVEVLSNKDNITAEAVSAAFLKLYQERRIRGIGASTLKSLEELNAGGHWSQVGRRGEYAAGNGAAMRIAPLAFFRDISREAIRDICTITHNNDDAYIGALCIIEAIRLILNKEWTGNENLVELIIERIPDSRVRDRLIRINALDSLDEVYKLGTSGYVVDSVPLAIAFANSINDLGFEKMLERLIAAGGDTDTNCSMAAQIVGTLRGTSCIPDHLFLKLKALDEYEWIVSTIQKF